jgi:beta-glucanase (GH16 family)
MYLKFDGTAIAASGPNDGVNLWARGPGQTLQGGALNDVLGGQSNDTLIGGGGDNQYYIQGWGDVIVQGPTGTNTVTTYMDYTLPDNIQNLNVYGAGLYASGNSLDNLITVGDDNAMQLYGAGGNNVLVGGAGSDTFIIDQTAGSDAIYNWHAGDVIRLQGGPLQTFAQLQADMTQQGSDVVVQNGTHPFVIRGATIAQFQASDFYLPLGHAKLGALTFDDEFNSLSLHSAANPGGTWTPNYWYGGIGAYTLTGNGELQLYTAPGFTGAGTADLGLNPFSVSNGVLDIHAQTVSAAQSAAMWNYQYASGVITTHDTFAQTYGYFEMRAELPTDVAGAWPAFWLVPADGSWPPELDAMETLSGSPNIDYTTQHSASGGSNWSVGSANLVTDVGGFHTYGVLWTATTLTWYLDGQELFQTATPADMNKPMYMIANMAVGGWAGAPNFASTDMYIDYIRAYGLSDGSSSWTSTVTPNTPSSALAADIPSSSVLLSGSSTTSGGGATAPPADTTSGQAVSVSDATYTAPEGVTSITLTGANQTVTGNNDGDTFISNNSGNALIGGTGADTFYMGRGGDWAAGGGGDNTFIFGGTPWAVDHIIDFTPGQDTIDLSGLLAASGYTGGKAIADGYIKIVGDPAGAQIWSNLSGTWWEVVILSGVSASALQMQGDVVSGAGSTAVAPPGAPALLPMNSIVNGYVNAAHDTAAQVLTGTAQAGAAITVYDGAQAIGSSVTADANGAWSVSIGVLGDGAHSLTAIASGAGGASPASAPLTFVVDTVAPIPSVSDVAIGSSSAVMSGQAEAGSTVSILDNGRALGAAIANASGSWSFNASLSGSGIHSLTENAVDPAGNAGSSPGVTLYSTRSGQTLTGGAGADVLIGRSGDTLTGGAGADHFVFNPSFGKETVNDFSPGTDQIWISHSAIADFAHLLAGAKQAGTDVTITADHNDVLTLHHMTTAALQSGDFLFF